MAAATALAFVVTPPTKTFVEGVSSRSLWSGLHSRLLPSDREHWFGLDLGQIGSRAPWAKRAAGTPDQPKDTAAPPLTTGSIGKSGEPAKP